MVVDGPPADCGADPDQGEPAGLLRLRAARKHEAARHDRRLLGERPDAYALHAQGLLGLAIDEIGLPEGLLDRLDRWTRTALGHDRDGRVVDREMALQVATIPGRDGCLKGSANLRLVLCTHVAFGARSSAGTQQEAASGEERCGDGALCPGRTASFRDLTN